MSEELEKKNKDLVKRAWTASFDGPVDLAVIDEVIDENYIQHNPLAAQGREGLKDFLINIFPKVSPSTMLDSKLVMVNYIAEGDLVVRQEVREDWMLVDILRIENGRLKEHWDAFRPEPGTERIPGF